MFELNKEEYKRASLINKIKFNVKNNNGFLYDLYKAYLKIKILLGIKSNPGHKSMTLNLNNFYLDEVCDSSGCRVSIDYTKQENFEKEFEKRLEKLTFLTKKFGAEPVFVTQRSFRWFKKSGRIFNYKKRQVYQSEKLRRDIIMDYCFKNNLFCIDVFNKLDLKINDTYDLVHLTPSGSKKLAVTIKKEILKNQIFFDKIKNIN